MVFMLILSIITQLHRNYIVKFGEAVKSPSFFNKMLTLPGYYFINVWYVFCASDLGSGGEMVRKLETRVFVGNTATNTAKTELVTVCTSPNIELGCNTK